MQPLTGKKTKFRKHSLYVHRHSEGLIRSRQSTANFSGGMTSMEDETDDRTIVIKAESLWEMLESLDEYGEGLSPLAHDIRAYLGIPTD